MTIHLPILGAEPLLGISLVRLSCERDDEQSDEDVIDDDDFIDDVADTREDVDQALLLLLLATLTLSCLNSWKICLVMFC